MSTHARVLVGLGGLVTGASIVAFASTMSAVAPPVVVTNSGEPFQKGAIQVERTNPLNLTSDGVIPVAVLTTEAGEYDLPVAFHATQIDPLSGRFGPEAIVIAGGGAQEAHELGHLEDAIERSDEVTSDGDLDMVLHFGTQLSELTGAETEACVRGTFGRMTGSPGLRRRHVRAIAAGPQTGDPITIPSWRVTAEQNPRSRRSQRPVDGLHIPPQECAGARRQPPQGRRRAPSCPGTRRIERCGLSASRP